MGNDSRRNAGRAGIYHIGQIDPDISARCRCLAWHGQSMPFCRTRVRLFILAVKSGGPAGGVVIGDRRGGSFCVFGDWKIVSSSDGRCCDGRQKQWTNGDLENENISHRHGGRKLVQANEYNDCLKMISGDVDVKQWSSQSANQISSRRMAQIYVMAHYCVLCNGQPPCLSRHHRHFCMSCHRRTHARTHPSRLFDVMCL